MTPPETTEATSEARPEETGRLPRDAMVGAAILIFCAAAYWVTLGFKEAPAALAQNVQPATFPQLVILVIAAFTALMMLFGLVKREKPLRRPKSPVLLTGVLMIGFILAFQHLGLMAAMVLFCLITPVIWGARLSLVLPLYAIVFPFLVYTVFVKGLGVYIDPGVMEPYADQGFDYLASLLQPALDLFQ